MSSQNQINELDNELLINYDYTDEEVYNINKSIHYKTEMNKEAFSCLNSCVKDFSKSALNESQKVCIEKCIWLKQENLNLNNIAVDTSKI